MNILDDLRQDLRYAFRQLARNKSLTAVVVLSLALGIGANTAIFSAIDAVMLRPLPVRNPQDLLMLDWTSKEFPELFIHSVLGGEPYTEGGGTGVFSLPTYKHIRDANSVFSDTFAFAASNETVNVGLGARAESAFLSAVSGNYFGGLNVTASLGRPILPEDDMDSAPAVATMSYGFWQRQLGRDPAIVGKTLVVNGISVSIVGVMPPEFYGLQPGQAPDLWVPLSLYMAETSQGGTTGGIHIYASSSGAEPLLRQPKTWWLGIAGRLKPGIPSTEANSELSGLFAGSIAPSGKASVPDLQMPRLTVVPLSRGMNHLRNTFSSSLFLLMASAGLVLLIACGNVAGLLLSRSAARRREVAIRLSLGVSRSRLMRQFLTESVLLAGLGGACGLLFAAWANAVLPSLLTANGFALNVELHVSIRVLAFTFIVSMIAGILFGLAPAIHATRISLSAAAKHGKPYTLRNRFTSRKALVCGQVALSLVIVTGAGLLIRTLQKLEAAEVGFDRRNILVFTVRPGLNGYSENRVIGYYEELQRRLQSLSGVRAVSLSTRGPVGSGTGSSGVLIPGYTPKEVQIYRHQVGPDYFETFGIPVVRGRGIHFDDRRNGKRIVVINQKLAQEYFHGDDPIGHQITFGGLADSPVYEIVGIAGDVTFNQVRTAAPATIYFPYQQFLSLPRSMTFEVRGEGNVANLNEAVRRAALSLDANVPLDGMRFENDVIDGSISIERAFAILTSFFGLLALGLACIGLYGTMSYAVSERTREVGIRMALGAASSQIMGTVLRETSGIVLSGLVLGVPLTIAAMQLLSARLYGIEPYDPGNATMAILAVIGATLLAGFIPARRASRVGPIVALRHE